MGARTILAKGILPALLALSLIPGALAQDEAPNEVPASQNQTRVREDNHTIEINSDGISPEAGTFRTDLIRLFRAVARRHPKRIVVFVHGGMVTLRNANKRAAELVPEIERSDPGTYPIFINWEAGLPSSYFRHLAFERNGVSYRGTPGAPGAVASSPLVFLADLVGGAARLLINTVTAYGRASQNADFLYHANPRMFPTRNKLNETLRTFSGQPDLSQKQQHFFRKGLVYRSEGQAPLLSLMLGQDSQRYLPWVYVQDTITKPLQVITEPVLDTFGTPAWGNMLRRTRSMFHPAGNFITRSSHSRVVRIPRSHDETPGAAALFFKALDRFLTNNTDINLDLIGHSMGTIVINDAYREFPNLRTQNLVYLAAACSIRDFQVTAGRYLADHPTNFYNLSLHPRAEIDEKNALGIPVRGSLLVWIDNFFESPESFGDRTLGTFENAVIAYKLLPQSSRIHLKAFPFESDNQTRDYGVPRKHGEMDDFEFWRKDFWDTAVSPSGGYRRNGASIR